MTVFNRADLRSALLRLLKHATDMLATRPAAIWKPLMAISRLAFFCAMTCSESPAILLFIKEHISTSIVRRKSLGNESFSKQIRTAEAMDILSIKGNAAVIYELQGSLFSGTANQLLSTLEIDIKSRKFITLDFKKVQGIDITAMHVLEQIRDMMEEKDGYLLFSNIPQNP